MKSKSSKFKLVSTPFNVPFTEWFYSSTIHRMKGNSSNTLIVVSFFESTVDNRAHNEHSKTGLRSSLAALEAEL